MAIYGFIVLFSPCLCLKFSLIKKDLKIKEKEKMESRTDIFKYIATLNKRFFFALLCYRCCPFDRLLYCLSNNFKKTMPESQIFTS